MKNGLIEYLIKSQTIRFGQWVYCAIHNILWQWQQHLRDNLKDQSEIGSKQVQKIGLSKLFSLKVIAKWSGVTAGIISFLLPLHHFESLY